MQAWEPSPVPFSELPNYDVAIIMGGVTNQYREPADRTYFGKGADRLLHPYQLYRQGKIQHFILSGGPASKLSSPTTEAETLATAMKALGLPDSLLTLEKNSMNTRDEAILCKKIIDSLFQNSPKILISTSAFHIKRTRLCFEKVGVNADYLATDFYSDSRPEQLISIFPSVQALQLWEILFKEWIGIIGYKLLGYA